MQKFEDFESWVKTKWGSQDQLAEKLDVAPNTVSSWKTGRNKIPPKIQDQIRKMGYDGPMPSANNEATREDLETLRNDLRAHQAWVLEEIRKALKPLVDGNVALGAVLQEILKRVPPRKGN